MTAYADVEDPAATLSAAADDRPGRQSTKELIEKAGWKIQGVNWIYEKVTGENLVESLINPLLGDFEKIDANANAWDQVSKAFDSVRRNLDAGVDQLGEYWQGDGASSFARRMDSVWALAIEADSQVARMIGDRFKSMANTCRTATSVALTLLDKLVTKLLEAAMTAWIPVVGWGTALMKIKDIRDVNDAVDRAASEANRVETRSSGLSEQDLAAIERHAESARAPRELKDLVSRIKEGELSWSDIASGRALDDEGVRAAMAASLPDLPGPTRSCARDRSPTTSSARRGVTRRRAARSCAAAGEATPCSTGGPRRSGRFRGPPIVDDVPRQRRGDRELPSR